MDADRNEEVFLAGSLADKSRAAVSHALPNGASRTTAAGSFPRPPTIRPAV